jgi:hypothetical protein
VEILILGSEASQLQPFLLIPDFLSADPWNPILRPPVQTGNHFELSQSVAKVGLTCDLNAATCNCILGTETTRRDGAAVESTPKGEDMYDGSSELDFDK